MCVYGAGVRCVCVWRVLLVGGVERVCRDRHDVAVFYRQTLVFMLSEQPKLDEGSQVNE